MSKRIVYCVRQRQDDWRVTRDGEKCGRAPTKALAVAFGRVNARADLAAGKPSQLVIYGEDGEVLREHTYG